MNDVHRHELVISGGTVVTPDGVRLCDIGIDDGKISTVGPGLAPLARRVVDVAGKVVLPGVIDAHVHCRTWTDHADEIAVSHRSAAFGGVTTAITQIRPAENMDPAEAIRFFIDEGERTSPIDFGLHTILRPETDVERAIPDVAGLGSPSVKFFLSYKDNGIMTPDAKLLRGLQTAGSLGVLTMVHADDGELIAHLIENSRAAGRVSLADLARAEPPSTEYLGTVKALLYAGALDAPLYVLHITSRGAVQALRDAHAAGQRAWGETCPKYLTLTNDELIRRGPVAKVGPPLRSRDDNASLWEGISDGTVQVVASDHAPRDRENLTQTDNVFDEPYGAPGTETLLPVIFDELVTRGRGTLRDVADVLSTNPAKIYGLYPRKGAISPGSDADLTIVDLDRPLTIRAATQHSTASYSLYEGRKVSASPTHTFVRGVPVLVDGEVVARPGQGHYLPRRPEDLLQLQPGVPRSGAGS